MHEYQIILVQQVSEEQAGSFLKLLVFEEPPLKIYMAIKNVPSCHESNIFICNSHMVECPLVNGTTTFGMSECIFNCGDTCAPVVTIGFQKSKGGQQTWSICELAELRNKHGRNATLHTN